MTLPEPQPGIMQISPYQGGESHVEGRRNVIKLSSNENPFGPSPAAREAYLSAAGELHRYPSSDHGALRAAIGDVHGLDPARIICGAGSDEIISLLCQAYAGPGGEVVHTEHGFLMYRISALAAGATPVEAPERERQVDVDAVLDACTDRTRLVFLANPANPTGTMISPAEAERLARGLPDGAMLVLDGAYAEYVEDFDGGARLVEQMDNVVMTRTFSKIHGLAALRVGWAYAPEAVIDVLNRVRGPFNVTAPALAAAEAAVRDQDWVARCRAENARLRGWLADALAAVGVPSDVSMANFILARLSGPEEAAACDAFLRERGILVRRMESYGLPAALRITVADEPAMRMVAEAVAEFRAARGVAEGTAGTAGTAGPVR